MGDNYYLPELETESLDTEELNNAQNALRDGALDLNQALSDAALPHGGVEIPPGSYGFSETVEITGQDVGFIGWGHGASDIQFSAAQELFQIGTATSYQRDTHFRDFRLEGDQSTGQIAFYTPNSYDTHLYNIYQRDMDIGFKADNSGDTRTIDIRLVDCVWERNTTGGILFDASQSGNKFERIRVSGGYSFGNNYGMLLKDGSVGDMRITDGWEAASNDKWGLRLEGVSNLSVTGAKIKNNNAANGGNYDLELVQDASGARANNNEFVNCNLGTVLIGGGHQGNTFIGGQVDDFQFSSGGGDSFVRGNTEIIGVSGWKNVASGTVTDAADGDTISYTLDDSAESVYLTVTENSTATAVVANTSTAIGGGAFELLLQFVDGSAVTSTDGVNVEWEIRGDTVPDR